MTTYGTNSGASRAGPTKANAGAVKPKPNRQVSRMPKPTRRAGKNDFANEANLKYPRILTIFMDHSVSPRQPRTMIFFIVTVVTAHLGSSVAAGAQTEQERVCYSTAETRDKILTHGLFEPFRAMRSAAGRMQAEAIGVKLCRWSEELVYELSLLRHDGHVIHVFIDAKTGQPIGSKNPN